MAEEFQDGDPFKAFGGKVVETPKSEPATSEDPFAQFGGGIVKKKAIGDAGANISKPSEIGGLPDLRSQLSGQPTNESRYSMVTDPVLKQQLLDRDKTAVQQNTGVRGWREVKPLQTSTKSVTPSTMQVEQAEYNPNEGDWKNTLPHVGKAIAQMITKPLASLAAVARDQDNIRAKFPLYDKNGDLSSYGKDVDSRKGFLSESDYLGRLVIGLDAYNAESDKDAYKNPLPHTFAGNTASGIIDIAPDIAATALLPEGKAAEAASYLNKLKSAVWNPFTKLMIAKGGLQGYSEAEQQGGTKEDAEKGAVIGALKGGAQGAEAGLLGGVAGEISSGAFKQIAKLGLFKDGRFTKAGLDALSDAAVFGAAPVATNLIQGKPFDKDEFQKGIGIGLTFGLSKAAKTFRQYAESDAHVDEVLQDRQASAVRNFMMAAPEAILEAYRMPDSAGDINAKAVEEAHLAKNTPDIKKRSEHAITASTLAKASDVKGTVDAILHDPEGFVRSIEESDLPDDQKQVIINKVSNIHDIIKIEPPTPAFNPLQQGPDGVSETEAQNQSELTEQPAQQPPSNSPSPEITDEQRAAQNAETDAKVKAFQEKFPDRQVDPLEDLPESVVRTFDRVDSDLPTDPVAINEASDWLYKKYKQLTAMKQSDTRMLTIDQIEAMQEQLGEDITLLENHKLKYHGDNEQVPAGEPAQQGPPEATEQVQPAEPVATGPDESTGNIEQPNQSEITQPIANEQTIEAPRIELPTTEEPQSAATTPENSPANSEADTGQAAEEQVKGEDPETENTKDKKILTNRAYEGQVADDVKKYLEEKGLKRKSFTRDERSKQATDFINKFGEDAAHEAVKNGDIEGGMAASILAQLQIRNSHEMAALPEGSEQRDLLAKKQADYIETLEKKGYSSGEFVGQLAHEYQNTELDYANVKKQVEKLTGKSLTPEQEEKVKKLTTENQSLKKKLREAEAKLIEETDKALNGDEPSKPNTKAKKEYAQKALDAVVKVRAKIRANSYSDATGIVAIVDSGLATIEAGIRTGMTITKAIEKGIEYIKAELKKKGTDIWDKEDDFRKDVTDAFSDEGIVDKGRKKTESLPEKQREAYIKKINKDISDLDEQIAKGEKAVKTKTDKYANDDEINKLRAERKAKVDELNEVDPRQKQASELSSAIKATEKSIADYEQKIADKKLPSKKVEKQYKSPELDKLRQKRDELSDKYEQLKKEIDIDRGKREAIERLEKQLDDLKNKRLKTSPEKRELSDEENELIDKIKTERLNITQSDLQAEFVDKTDNKFTIEQARGVWSYMKGRYLENGESFKDAMSKTADDLGLSWRQISEAITSPKNKRISDEMWKQQADYSRNNTVIKSWIADQNKSSVGKVLQRVSGLFRGISVFGHGGIFIGTHAGMTVFNPSTWKTVIPAFIKAWKFAYGNEGNYHRAMEELKNSPNYIIAQRAGLKNNPERLNAEEYQNSQKYLGKLGLAGERGFNAIKVLRQELFDREYSKLTPAEKADPEVAKSLAQIFNLATGATDLKIPKWVNEVSFAGGMEASRWQKLTQSPAKATQTALNAIFNPSKASVADRVFAKVWARRVGEQLATYTAALAVNAAIQNTINPKNPTNLTNPNKPDFGKFKFGDLTIDPTSGMRSTAAFMYKLGKIPFQSQKELHGDKRISALGKDLAGYGRGKLAPFYSTGADFFTGQDFNGNVMPYSNDRPKDNAHKLTWGEYAWSKAPLPVAEAANVAYKSALEHGAHKPTLDNVLEGILSGAISGTTGFRVGEYDSSKEKK